ncbi:ribonuclease R [uncultured Neglectibacter sp.]|uniref:ribonuclease R n=1 Tax=uncultured Neglectibacter sp. TaxID=1924108 RepID=UPI0034DE9D2C
MERRNGSTRHYQNQGSMSRSYHNAAFGGSRNREEPYELPSAASTLEEKLIVAALKRCGGNGVPSKSLMREAGIREKNDFYEALHKLEELGEITVDKDHWVKLVPHTGDVVATLVALSERFGFAKPKIGTEDIFIPGAALQGAFVGDEVLLTDLRKGDKGPSARIKRILSHSTAFVTGTVHIDADGARVTPDGAIRYDMEISPTHLHGAKDGDKVLILPKCDGRGEWRTAEVQSVFGSGDRARVCADAIIERCGIPTEFPPEVLAEAEAVADLPVTQKDIDSRLDLRDEPVFTIDSADAKDLDDAISVRKTADGYTLGVHIADVSHYVKAGSAIDREAFLRGTSVYFADRVIPMLPEALSNGACSLNAGMDKLTFSALMDFDSHGNMTDYLFRKTVIHSKVRGVYSEVNEILAGKASQDLLDKYAPVRESLEAAKELADILKRNAQCRGEMDLSSDETKFVLDENGVCIDLLPRTTGEAEELVEQMMISANIAAAKTALDAGIPFLYRIHEKPRPDRVEELYELLDRLGIACGELKKGNPTAADFSTVLERVKGGSRESLVNQRILRTMEKARYADRELGHFGLALGEYSHFTSPIRRYPDTSIHRILSDLAAGESKETITKRYKTFAGESALQSSQNEIRAVTGERAAEDCYTAEYMRAHLGERHVGIISGVTPKGIFVKLQNNAEGFVSLNDFENADFEFDGEIAHHDLRSGRVLVMGEEIGIIVAGADVATGRIDFVPQEA